MLSSRKSVDAVFKCLFVYRLSGLASYRQESGVLMDTLGIDRVDTNVWLLSRGSGTGEFGELWRRLSYRSTVSTLLPSSKGTFSSASSCLSARLNCLASLLLLYSAKRLSAIVLSVSPTLFLLLLLFLAVLMNK